MNNENLATASSVDNISYSSRDLPSRLRIPRQASRILLVRGLGPNPESAVIYREFGVFGSIQQVRCATDPKHGELVVIIYDDVLSAFAAFKKLNGFVLNSRNIRIKFHQLNRRQLIV